MMDYFLQSCIGITLWWLAFRAFLHGSASAKTNRFFLIGGLILPLALPFLPLSQTIVATAQPVLLPAIHIGDAVGGGSATDFNWFLWLYLVGFCVMLWYQLGGVFTFLRLKKLAQKDAATGVYRLDGFVMPFSFFSAIFLPKQLFGAQEEIVVAHEKWHIKLGHSYDVTLLAAVQTVLWFFPILHFYGKDLRAAHENEVDAQMLKNTSFSTYAETLLQINMAPIGHAQFHSFSSSNLKNRFKMMTKRQKQNTWKLLFFLPLIAALTYLNASNQNLQPPVAQADFVYNASVPPRFSACPKNNEAVMAQECFNIELLRFLTNNIKYPQAAKDAEVNGVVHVSFTIDAKGEIASVFVKNSTVSDNDFKTQLEAAAFAVFRKFPKVDAAMQNGKPVSISYDIPISFAVPVKEGNATPKNQMGPFQNIIYITGEEGC